MKIGIIIAMDKEFEHVKKLLSSPTTRVSEGHTFVEGTMGENTVIMSQCGIGKVNAAIGSCLLAEHYRPDIIISTGVAGGASTALEIQDVVVSTETCYHDVYCGPEVEFGQIMGMPERFRSAEGIVKKAVSLNCGTTIHKGLIVTGDWFVDTVEKMRKISDRFPEAMAVDMESAAIAHVCCKRNIPFVSFRIISDIPLKEGNAQQYTDFWGSMAEKSFNATKAFLQTL